MLSIDEDRAMFVIDHHDDTEEWDVFDFSSKLKSPKITPPFQGNKEFKSYITAATKVDEERNMLKVLPLELWRDIVDHLPLLEQLQCLKTCSFFKNIVLDQLKIRNELQITKRGGEARDSLRIDTVFFKKGIGFDDLLNYLPQLRSLSIPDHFSLSAQYDIMCGLERNISVLKNLVELEVALNYADEFLGHIFQHGKNLTVLQLSRCVVKSLKTTFQHFCLRLASFSFPTSFDNEDNNYVYMLDKTFASSGESLQCLQLYCPSLRQRSDKLRVLCRIANFLNLRTLQLTTDNIIHCVTPTDQPNELHYLASLSHLEQIFLRPSPCVHLADIRALTGGCRKLRNLTLNDHIAGVLQPWNAERKLHKKPVIQWELNPYYDPSHYNTNALPALFNLDAYHNVKHLEMTGVPLGGMDFDVIAPKLKSLKTLILFGTNVRLSSLGNIVSHAESLNSVTIGEWFQSAHHMMDELAEEIVVLFYEYAVRRSKSNEQVSLELCCLYNNFTPLTDWTDFISTLKSRYETNALTLNGFCRKYQHSPLVGL